MILRLAGEGFCGGDPQRIEETPTDLVLDAWELINFQNEFEETVMELNRPTP